MGVVPTSSWSVFDAGTGTGLISNTSEARFGKNVLRMRYRDVTGGFVSGAAVTTIPASLDPPDGYLVENGDTLLLRIWLKHVFDVPLPAGNTVTNLIFQMFHPGPGAPVSSVVSLPDVNALANPTGWNLFTVDVPITDDAEEFVLTLVNNGGGPARPHIESWLVDMVELLRQPTGV